MIDPAIRDVDGLCDRMEWLAPAVRDWLARLGEPRPVAVHLVARDVIGRVAVDGDGHPTFSIGLLRVVNGCVGLGIWARFEPVDEADPSGRTHAVLDGLLDQLAEGGGGSWMGRSRSDPDPRSTPHPPPRRGT